MIDRRSFLRGGGLLIGFSLSACRGRPALFAEADRAGDLMPNAWVRIGTDDVVTFYLDRVEMGQGTMTSHVTLLAEELEVDPRAIVVEHAIADRLYDNPDPALGFQITGGSTSTKTAWEPLRRAGATAREMLRAAAAERWGVPIESCRAVGGAIVHPSGRRARYGALATDASRRPAPKDPPLKKTFTRVGRSIPRLDARAKVEGRAVFGIDVQRPGLLHAIVVRSEVAGGRVIDFDAEAAKKAKGIVAVFAVTSGVAIVAERSYQARAAAEGLRVRFDHGPLASVDSGALREAYARRADEPMRTIRDDGDLATAGRSKTAKVVRAVYQAPYLAHATMEPMNCTAHVHDGRVEIWAPTQSPGLARALVARTFGWSQDAITVHATFLGGGFGRRLAQDYVIEAVEIAREVGRPVKVLWSREDDLRHDFYRPASHGVLEGVVDGGRVVGWSHRIVSQSIVSQIGRDWIAAIAPNGAPDALVTILGRTATALYETGIVHDATSTEGASDFPYAIPNLRVQYAQVEPGVPVGFWRAVGNSENVFVVESFLDELAGAAGVDPYAMRRALLAHAPRDLAVLDLAAKAAGWGTAPRAGVGRGIAYTRCFESRCAQVAEVVLDRGRPRVTRVVAAIDCGRVVNPDLVRAQIESAIVFGLSAAAKQRITFERGRAQQTNLHQFDAIRIFEAPKIEVEIVPSEAPPTGVGETGLPPIAPAVVNAIAALTGVRVRSLPYLPEWRT